MFCIWIRESEAIFCINFTFLKNLPPSPHKSVKNLKKFLSFESEEEELKKIPHHLPQETYFIEITFSTVEVSNRSTSVMFV